MKLIRVKAEAQLYRKSNMVHDYVKNEWVKTAFFK